MSNYPVSNYPVGFFLSYHHHLVAAAAGFTFTFITLSPMSRLQQKRKETENERLARLGLTPVVMVEQLAELENSFHARRLAPSSLARHEKCLKRWRNFAQLQKNLPEEILPGLDVPPLG
jgi:hypothetical protein